MSAKPAQAKKSAQKTAHSANPHHLSAKQIRADRANLAKARAKARTLPRTAKQVAASRHNLVKARAAQRARKGKKQGAQKKTAQAPLLDGLGLHLLPACGAVAVAASLQAWTGLTVPAAGVWDLYLKAGETSIENVLGVVADTGLAGWRLAAFEPADPGIFHPWLLYGLQLAHGYHAVLATASGMLSWGMELPLAGEPQEAWMLEWAELA